MSETVVATFYKFVTLTDAAEKRDAIWEYCQDQDVLGSILIALEGINGTIAGSAENVAAVLAFLRLDPRLKSLESRRTSSSGKLPFRRLKVKFKEEIVTFGIAQANPLEQVGTYVQAKDWNSLIEEPGVLVIDTRNHYEVEIGTFKGAINPKTETFSEFPEYVRQHLDPQKHKKIAMFCTGGIRCEKASAFMLQEGFTEVYHLQGGILEYLREVHGQESLWEGECFVFDERVALKEGLENGSSKMCYGCGYPMLAQEESECAYCKLRQLKSESQSISNRQNAE